MFKGLAKKKKVKKTEKKSSKASEATDFDAKLAEAGADKGGEEKVEEEESIEGDLEKGTGIWHHDATQDLKYPQLLERFFQILTNNHPDLMSNGVKSYKIPPPQCLREGNKKTIFANIAEICKRMKRSDEHVTSYLFAELGTSGSVDGSRRLVIKGRFQQKVNYRPKVSLIPANDTSQQIENVLRRYIGTYERNLNSWCTVNTISVEYVTCKTCRSPDTELNKGENRLYFVTCNSCGSRRSVTAIKTGFSAQIGKRKRQQA